MTKFPEEKRNILDESTNTFKEQGGVEAGAFPLRSQARRNTCDFTDPVSGGSEANGSLERLSEWLN